VRVFSSIEWVWRYVKRDYIKRQTYNAMRRDYGQVDVVNCIKLACEGLSEATLKSCSSANWGYINSYLDDDKRI